MIRLPLCNHLEHFLIKQLFTLDVTVPAIPNGLISLAYWKTNSAIPLRRDRTNGETIYQPPPPLPIILPQPVRISPIVFKFIRNMC